MESLSSCSVIIIGAGISGMAAAKALADKGVEDLVILEATDRIGGRIRKEEFAGLNVELGAGWIQGVGGKEPNPVWELATKSGLRTCYSDYSNARFNIYDKSGKIFPRDVADVAYTRAVESAICKLRNEKALLKGVSSIKKPSISSLKPIELAIDFVLHDFEMAEVEPIATYTDFGEGEFLVADERGYEHLLYKMAESFLLTKNGDIVDNRLMLNKVVREVQYSSNGVTVATEDNCLYHAKYVVLSVSIGVLQTNLINFSPPLPKWKTKALSKVDIIVYTKIYLKFPYKFWPCGPGTEFFLYAHEKRGYYTFWQHMENAYPGSNILVVTLTNEESKRVEMQSEEQTLREAMGALRDMFGPKIPEATHILVPKWWNNRFQRGSYTNYPLLSNPLHFAGIKAPVGPIFFTGEHTHEKFSGYVHGGYLSGIDTSKALLEVMMREKTSNSSSSNNNNNNNNNNYNKKMRLLVAILSPLRGAFSLAPWLTLTRTLTQHQQGILSWLQKWKVAKQLFHSSKLFVQQRAIK